MTKKRFSDYKLKPLTLSEREECSNLLLSFKNFYSEALSWLRYGLSKLKGVDITKDNFDIEVNKLSDTQIKDIAADIRERTQFPDKKKQS